MSLLSADMQKLAQSWGLPEYSLMKIEMEIKHNVDADLSDAGDAVVGIRTSSTNLF